MRALLAPGSRVLVTGGAGFIASCVVRRLLRHKDATVFNLDKLGYASEITSIEQVLEVQGAGAEGLLGSRHQLQQGEPRR